MSPAEPTPPVCLDPALVAAAEALAAGPQRRRLGITGAPAAGKSTLAEALADRLGTAAAYVPMDGFHLSQRQLQRLGRAGRKGAPDTFDALGYRDLLQRLGGAAARGETVFAPGFYRGLEEPIAASIAIPPEAQLIITEGNYLLIEDAPWPTVTAALDEVWYLDLATTERERRLLDRHMRFGRSEAEARAWMAATDRPNAERVSARAARADRRVVWDESRICFCG